MISVTLYRDWEMRVTGSTKPNRGLTTQGSHLIGVAGGSGSGKTFFAEALKQRFGSELCEIVYQDNFYIDQSARFDFDGGSVNFDHPDSIDFELLSQCLEQLKRGEPAEIPIYDFITHSRRPETLHTHPKAVIIVDGILIFHAENVRSIFDELIFFDTPEELRYSRRMDRDVKHRGRTPEGVRQQFLNQVKPMHDQFVEPSKIHAHTLVSELQEFDSVLEAYCQKLSKRLLSAPLT